MFNWLNNQGVRSDRGFEFQRTGRFTAEYRENGKVTDMYVEGDGVSLTIYEGSLEGLWNRFAPEQRAVERNRIIGNIRDALAFQKLELILALGPEPDF